MRDSPCFTTPTPDTFDEIARILSMAFAGPVDGSRAWIDRAGAGNLRVLRDESPGAPGPIAATLLRIPMGHFVGGRSVACIGIAGVAVPPERRGGGLASRLMGEALREIHAEGVALSSLYAATQPLYRGVGYEQAWHRFAYSIPLARVRADPPGPPARRADPTDPGVQETIRGIYARCAARHNALLDRGAYIWNRIFQPRDSVASTLLFGEREAEAYVVFAQARDPRTGRHDVVVHDAASVTPVGWARALGALGRFRTTANDLLFHAGPTHPWFNLDRDHVAVPQRFEPGMLRIAHVEAALRARGYSPHVDAEVLLEIRDDTIPENSGRWRVAVRRGRAEVGRHGAGRAGSGGSTPTARLSINALAALYTSFLTAHEAADIGWVEGPPESLDALSAIFAGPTPWMPEQF